MPLNSSTKYNSYMQYVKKKKLLRRANTELLHTLKLHAKIRDRPRLPSIVCIQLMLERETDISPPPRTEALTVTPHVGQNPLRTQILNLVKSTQRILKHFFRIVKRKLLPLWRFGDSGAFLCSDWPTYLLTHARTRSSQSVTVQNYGHN